LSSTPERACTAMQPSKHRMLAAWLCSSRCELFATTVSFDRTFSCIILSDPCKHAARMACCCTSTPSGINCTTVSVCKSCVCQQGQHCTLRLGKDFLSHMAGTLPSNRDLPTASRSALMRAKPLTALPRSVRLLRTIVSKLFTRCTSCTNTCTTAMPQPHIMGGSRCLASPA